VGALRAGSAQRPLSEINVTPFVDVMLVLLIIFMVTAPMMQQGVDVDLPKTTTQNLRIKDEPLVLTVKQDGKYYLGRKEIAAADLGTSVRSSRPSSTGSTARSCSCAPTSARSTAWWSRRSRRLARRARPSSGWSRSPSHRSCGGGTS
jgi:hypothetical protein